MTNLEGRVILHRRAFDPPAGVRTDLEVLCDLATRLGKGQFFAFTQPRQVFDELRRASAQGVADYSGITYEKIEAKSGVFWPCPAEDHPGTPHLFLHSFPTPTGRARFHAIQHQAPAEEVDANYPLYLTTGRVLAQYQSGTQTQRVAQLRELASRNSQAVYQGSQIATRLKVMGVELTVMGEKEPAQESDEVVTYADPSRGVYKKLIVRDRYLAGAILLGDGLTAPRLLQVFDRGEVLPENRTELSAGNRPAHSVP